MFGPFEYSFHQFSLKSLKLLHHTFRLHNMRMRVISGALCIFRFAFRSAFLRSGFNSCPTPNANAVAAERVGGGALAPLIVKFRGLSPPKMYRVCPTYLAVKTFSLGRLGTRLQYLYALLI